MLYSLWFHLVSVMCTIYSIRSCGDLKRIYMLVRPKKGKQPVERIKDMLDNVVSNTKNT